MKHKYHIFLTAAVAVFFASAQCTLMAGGDGAKPALRIHIEASDQLPDNRMVTIKLERPPKYVSVPVTSEVSEKDLIGAAIHPTMPGAVMLTFNAHGKKSLNLATSINRGRHLVVFVNGRVVFAPVIDTTLPNGKILIPSGVSLEETRILAEIAKRNQQRKL